MKLNKALILIIIFTGLLSLETSNLNAQCQINSISPSTLSFAGYEGEVKYLTFGMSGGCSLSFSTPPFLQVIQTNSTQLKVTLVNRSTYPGAMTAGFGIMSNGTTLRSVPVNIGSGTTTQLSGGTISISQTTVGNNQSPGTFANSSSASGGSGNYGYQWHKSTNNGSTWSSITGATSLTYSCPALTQTTRFRRKVTSGTLTAYSNEITITVLGVCQITGANPSTLNMVGYSGESKIITLLGENLSVLYPITFGTPGFIQFERISDNQIKGTIVSDITYSAGGNIAIIITGDTNPPFLLPFSFAGVSTVKASSTENYILSYNPQVEVKNETEFHTKPLSSLSPTIQYFDGLGRPKQTISVVASPGGKDIVQPIVYDAFGREQFKYLPYAYSDASNKGSIRPNPSTPTGTSEQKSFYTNSSNTTNGLVIDSNPYSETVFESSPLNRVLQQGAPGAVWQPGNPDTDHTVRYSYETNTSGEVCLLYVEGDILKQGKTIDGTFYASYPKNQLYKTVVKDENWTSDKGKLHTTEEFKDKSGNIVLKRSYIKKQVYTNVWVDFPVDTYYAYDNFGLLRYVLPPEASKQLSLNTSTIQTFSRTHATIIKPWCYFYKYDARKRMIEKQIPGADPVYMVYDKRDRLVLTQDGEQRLTNKWLFTKYDQLNRPIMTGVLSTSSSHNTLCNDFYNYTGQLFETVTNSGNIRYSLNSSYPNTSSLRSVSESNLLTVTYYDNYNFLSADSFSGFEFDSLKSVDDYGDTNNNVNYFDDVKGLVTGSQIKVLDGLEYTSSGKWLGSVNYYDDRYRVLQTVRHLYPRTTSNKEWISNKYDFTGKILITRVDQYFQGISKKVVLTNGYDHAGRLTSITHSIDNATPVSLAAMSYNELGQLKTKVHHTNKQYVDYAYNIRGWLTQINNPASATTAARQFAMKLHYDTAPSNVTAEVQYNGNIAAMEWRARDLVSSTTSGKLQGYGYKYDGLNRLITADFGEGSTNTATTLTNYSKFDVAISEYDLNGNIKRLSRRTTDGSMMDNLTYYFGSSGNLLQAVQDDGNDNLGFIEKSFLTSGEYTYDMNGNLKKDLNKGITNIVYNYMNLPQKVLAGSQSIDYIYSADGAKHAKISPDGATTYYAGGFVYKMDAGSTSSYLDYIQHNEGLVQYTGTNSSSYEYQYYLKDHLGNTRVVVDQNNTREQQSAYYPFGMSFDKAGSTDNPYLYNGKEQQTDLLAGRMLDWYDYGARFYEPAIARWHAIDPLAELFVNKTSYGYVSNNPISRIDPDGRIDVSGSHTYNNQNWDWEWNDLPNPNWKPNEYSVNNFFRKNCSDYHTIARGPGDPNNEFGDQYVSKEVKVSPSDSPSLKGEATNGGGETWYYGVQSSGVFDVGHAFSYNPNTGMIYEINHPSADPNDGPGSSGISSALSGTQSGNVVSIGYKYNMNTQEGRESFFNFRGGRPPLVGVPINVPNPQAATAFFESWVGQSWDYSFLTNNCKHFVGQGLSQGGASIYINSPSPVVWEGRNVHFIGTSLGF